MFVYVEEVWIYLNCRNLANEIEIMVSYPLRVISSFEVATVFSIRSTDRAPFGLDLIILGLVYRK